MNKYIRKGDTVVCTAGNEKGRFGKVALRGSESVVVSGLNMKKRHVKRTQQGPGRIVEMEGPIHISNVRLAKPDGTALKVRVQVNKAGEKELVYTENNQAVVYRSVKREVKG